MPRFSFHSATLLLTVLMLFQAVEPSTATGLKESSRSISSAVSSARTYFDTEDVLLFMVGLGLASILGLATFMAPFTSIIATGLTPIAVPTNAVVTPTGAAATAGRRRRRDAVDRKGFGTHELTDVLRAIENAFQKYAAGTPREQGYSAP